MKPSAARKNTPKLSDRDIMGKLRPLYMMSPRKLEKDLVFKAVGDLVSLGLIKESQMDAVKIWSITEQGSDALTRLYEGEEIEL